MKTNIWLFTACLLAMLSSALAQSVPPLINYQGRLTDQTGAPLTAGAYGIQFRLWDFATATNSSDLIWAQQQNLAVQSNGVFNVILGSPGGSPILGATPAVNSLAYAFAGSNCFLGVTIASSNSVAITSPSEILPRQQLLSVPFAITANTAFNVVNSPIPHGVVVMWSGTIGSIPPGWVLCNGQNGVPDLRNRFVVGADGDVGGQALSTYTGSPTQSGGSVHHTHSGKTGYSADWYSPGHDLINQYPNDWDVNPCIDHDHPFTTANENIIPVVYYALAYIMKN